MVILESQPKHQVRHHTLPVRSALAGLSSVSVTPAEAPSEVGHDLASVEAVLSRNHIAGNGWFLSACAASCWDRVAWQGAETSGNKLGSSTSAEALVSLPARQGT